MAEGSTKSFLKPNTGPQNRIFRKFLTERGDVLCAVALCLLTLLTWLPRWRGPIDIRWDGGTYFILGTSLAEGKGYRLLNEPGDIQADQYPPLLPAIVALHEKALGTRDPVQVGIWLRRTWIIISVTYVLFAFLLARLLLSRIYAFWVGVVCLMSYDMYYLATLCFTELPFALMAVLFAWCYLREEGRSWTRGLTPVFAIAAYLLRSMGIALLGAWVLDALFKRQFRAAVIRATIALVPVISWQTYVHSVEVSREYRHPSYVYQRDPSMFYNVSYSVNMRLKDPFAPDKGFITTGDLLSRMTGNVAAMPSTLGQSISAREGFYRGHVRSLNQTLGRNLVPHWPYKILLNVLGALVILGIVQMIRQGQWLIAGTIALTLGAICTTPWPGQFARYIAPILPFLLLALGTLLGMTKRTAGTPVLLGNKLRALRFASCGLIFCECCLALQSGNRNFINRSEYRDRDGQMVGYNLLHYSSEYEATKELLKWLRPRANRDAVIAVTMPQWVYLVSGFKSVMAPLTTDPAKAQEQMDTVPVSFFIVEELLMDDNFNTFSPGLIRSSPGTWKLVFAMPNSNVRLYARRGIAYLSGSVVTD